jgi:spermidine synthase
MHPVERVDVAENCAPVVESAKYFENWNRRVVSHPRTRLWREDARTILKLRPQLYDVIINEPSNPWTVGVGSVFSREYYELAASRLKPGGLVIQWFHVYEMQDSIVDLVLRTFSSVFPYTEIWDAAAGDILIIGSMAPWRTDAEVFRPGFAVEAVRSDLAGIGIHSPEQLLARQLASQRTGFAIASDGPMESDMFPQLEHIAPVAFFIGQRSRLLGIFDERTRQQSLAPPLKQAALRSLSPASSGCRTRRRPPARPAAKSAAS